MATQNPSRVCGYVAPPRPGPDPRIPVPNEQATRHRQTSKRDAPLCREQRPRVFAPHVPTLFLVSMGTTSFHRRCRYSIRGTVNELLSIVKDLEDILSCILRLDSAIADRQGDWPRCAFATTPALRRDDRIRDRDFRFGSKPEPLVRLLCTSAFASCGQLQTSNSCARAERWFDATERESPALPRHKKF
jgi:hypothetical protein